MKSFARTALATVLSVTLAGAAAAGVGDNLKNTEQIEDFAQTGAESWTDLQGRAVLVEFFAYW